MHSCAKCDLLIRQTCEFQSISTTGISITMLPIWDWVGEISYAMFITSLITRTTFVLVTWFLSKVKLYTGSDQRQFRCSYHLSAYWGNCYNNTRAKCRYRVWSMRIEFSVKMYYYCPLWYDYWSVLALVSQNGTAQTWQYNRLTWYVLCNYRVVHRMSYKDASKW